MHIKYSSEHYIYRYIYTTIYISEYRIIIIIIILANYPLTMLKNKATSPT